MLGNQSITAGNILTKRITYNSRSKSTSLKALLMSRSVKTVVVNDFRKCGNHTTTSAEYGLEGIKKACYCLGNRLISGEQDFLWLSIRNVE